MARIRAEDIDALRERASIVDLASAYSSLKKTGANTYKGLCPFHSEKTPSFTVDEAKGLWHCFGCQEGGDIYRFVEKVESLPFSEAAEWLARKVGFQLRYEESRPGEQRAQGLRARIVAANEAAARFFHDRLLSSPDAVQARRYLESRNFSKEVAQRWQLGYAPGRDALCKHLVGRGFSHEELERADLIRKSERDLSYFDSFRNRIVFPTWNLQGDVVGFGARALGDVQPKYLNTAETPAFSKSRVLYGLNRAKSAIARDAAIVVEGYTDVIALHEAGIKEAVATNGVALGATHFELLKKFSQRAVLMLDSDEAGRGATERGFDIMHRIGLEVLAAPLPAGRDPAEVVASDGVEGIRKAIDAARPLLELKLEQAVARLPLDTPEARSRAVGEAVGVMSLHPDPIARHEYVFTAARMIGVEPDAIRRALAERPWTSRDAGDDRTPTPERRLPGHVKVEREALLLLLIGDGKADEWARDLDDSHFTSGTRRELFRFALEQSEEGTAIERMGDLTPDAQSLFTELYLGERGSASQDPSERVPEVFTRLKVFSVEREIKARRTVLEDINPIEDPVRHDTLFTELVAREAQRRELLKQMRGTR
jgi:DNA primase